MKLSGKTREELVQALAGADRERLVDLIYELTMFERLLSSGEIAKASRIDVREVLADMRAGRFVDPIHGRGFFSRATNSFKVSVCAANRWRREWFVPRELRSIPAKKTVRALRTVSEGKTRDKTAMSEPPPAIAAAWQIRPKTRGTPDGH